MTIAMVFSHVTDSSLRTYRKVKTGNNSNRSLTDLRYGASQADVASFKACKKQPNAEKYPHSYRWYKHIATFDPEFSTLPGDPSKSYSAYGPESSEATLNHKETPTAAEADEEEEDDLFGSDEEEDEEAVKQREANLAAYKKKKEGKTKPAAKSIVTLDVKPWGKHLVPNMSFNVLSIRELKSRFYR